MNGSPLGLAGIAIPIGLVWLKLGIAFTRMARRKGTNANMALLGAFPLWALLFGLWLMLRPNALPTGDDEQDDMSAAAEEPASNPRPGGRKSRKPHEKSRPPSERD
jgi:hypothetical protein